jgi:hypothetical protein
LKSFDVTTEVVFIDSWSNPGKSAPPKWSVLPKGIKQSTDIARPEGRTQPVDWRYKLIRRLLAHC